MATKQINQIEYGGEVYEFVDEGARESNLSLSQKVTRLDDEKRKLINDENERATLAERALNDSKVDKEAGKTLTSNDFTDSYKDLLDNPRAMQGASSTADGVQGDVPAPSMGEEGMYLDGSGHWTKPHDTTYEDVTQLTHGLMTPEDKIKLDAMDKDSDDTVSANTIFGDGVITQTLGNGKTITTTFNADGSITQTIAKAGMETITLTTVFNADGSITRTRS